MGTMQAIKEVLHDLWRFTSAGFSYRPLHTTDVLDGFHEGARYAEDNRWTTQTRLMLSGLYTEQQIKRPLQPGEYAMAKLQEKGYHVPKEALTWLPGQWHMKLKGQAGVHIGVSPKVGAVMEFFDADSNGRLGLVSYVSREESITLESIGMHESGVFETHVIPKASWQALGPVFTSFTKASSV